MLCLNAEFHLFLVAIPSIVNRENKTKCWMLASTLLLPVTFFFVVLVQMASRTKNASGSEVPSLEKRDEVTQEPVSCRIYRELVRSSPQGCRSESLVSSRTAVGLSK